MKFKIAIVLFALVFAFSCKNDSTTSTQTKQKSVNKVDLPTVYKEFSVPVFPNGLITDDRFNEEGRRQEWVTVFSTEKSFDEIYQFYMDYYKNNGWTIRMKVHKDKGEDTEAVILEATQKGTKHDIFAVKETIRTNKIKSSVVRYTS